MPAAVFTIVELRPTGQAERFDWTSATSPVKGTRGGARAAPLGPWTMGVTQHLVRTDYPGARVPSHQVLGARRKPFTIHGHWQDKYNFPGYAEETQQRFEEMVERGHVVRFQMGRHVLEGIVEDYEPEVVGSWLINYSFTVSVNRRAGKQQLQRSPLGPLNTVERFNDVDLAVAALQEANASIPKGTLTGSTAADVALALANATAARSGLAGTLDQLGVHVPELPTAQFPRIATQFRTVGAGAQQVVDALTEVRSDVEVAYQTAKSVIDFELWSRSMRFFGRLLIGRCADGAADTEERASPNAERLYRPSEGESLYKIARKMLGKAEAWRQIADRNGLSTFVMTGDEVLIIPERAG